MTAESLPVREINAEAIHLLGLVALEAVPKEKMIEVYESFGPNLNLSEVTLVAGVLTEEYENPKIKESSVVRKSIYELGKFALKRGDFITADSSAHYLLDVVAEKLSRFYGKLLLHRLQKKATTPNPLQTS